MKTLPGFRPLLIVALAIAVVGATFWAGARAAKPAYKRFVSQPLPDGTRYTFRYPATLPKPVLRTPRLLCAETSFPTRLGVMDDVRVRIGLPYHNDRFRLTVTGGPQPFLNPFWLPRWEHRWSRDWESRHEVELTDVRSRTHFVLRYVGETPPPLNLPAPHLDPMVAQSFRILPPGAPVPNP